MHHPVTGRLTSRTLLCLSTERFTRGDAVTQRRETRPMRFERALSAAGELLLGAACHGCSEPWWGICPRCRAAVLSHGCFATRPDPLPRRLSLHGQHSTVRCDPAAAVAAHKERGALHLTPFLAGRLAAAIEGVLHFTDSPGAPWCWFRCRPRVPSCGSEVSMRPGLWRAGPPGCSDGSCRYVPAGCCIRRVRYSIRRG